MSRSPPPCKALHPAQAGVVAVSPLCSPPVARRRTSGYRRDVRRAETNRRACCPGPVSVGPISAQETGWIFKLEIRPRSQNPSSTSWDRYALTWDRHAGSSRGILTWYRHALPRPPRPPRTPRPPRPQGRTNVAPIATRPPTSAKGLPPTRALQM